jgi:uncharacterized membrane protein YozB (DUF420 family)
MNSALPCVVPLTLCCVHCSWERQQHQSRHCIVCTSLTAVFPSRLHHKVIPVAAEYLLKVLVTGVILCWVMLSPTVPCCAGPAAGAG